MFAWFLLVLAAIYVISPIDLIPDAPPIGWLDDFLILLIAILNLIRQHYCKDGGFVSSILKRGLIAISLFVVFCIAIITLLVVVVVRLCNS